MTKKGNFAPLNSLTGKNERNSSHLRQTYRRFSGQLISFGFNMIRILENLKKTVAETLERKRKLGQYAVIWDGHKSVQSGPDAPVSKD